MPKKDILSCLFFLFLLMLFTQEALAKILPVKVYVQKYSLSCEAASAKAVLDYLGNTISEDNILKETPYEKTPLTVSEKGEMIWGDPNKGFVGEYNGVSFKTGYGIYAGPLAITLQKLGFKAQAHKNYTLSELYFMIKKNRPSVVWVPSAMKKNSQLKTWKTPEGKTVEGIIDEHTMVFVGADKKKKLVYLMDVASGQNVHYSEKHFLEAWGHLKHQALTFP